MRYTAFVISQLVHLFCYSLQGQKLIDHSLQMRNKIYNSSWYNIPAKSQRLLLYVMRRSMQPNFLSAGKIYVFSLKSFTTASKASSTLHRLTDESSSVKPGRNAAADHKASSQASLVDIQACTHEESDNRFNYKNIY
ncbi:hypothetical protein ALC57_02782 [Trachymyrmex cornetzi]|uniref:Uncharacterized protein n=1 Tax=Trachymyrmex cornetzi TaxID=471704 RepID=A0A195EHH0_9HYME|nr:hypothetical protein ALC57_02782 [Trachymyrmex cornetzi]